MKRDRRASGGYTLAESLLALGLVAMLMALALVGMEGALTSWRVKQAANDIAWVLRTDAKRKRIGFVHAKDLRRGERYILEDEAE